MTGLQRLYGSLTGRMVFAAVLLHALLIPVLAIGIHKNVADGIRDEFVNNARSSRVNWHCCSKASHPGPP